VTKAADDARLLRPAEAAALLQVSESTMKGWRMYGGGPRYTRVGRQVRYLEAEVLEWAEKRGIDQPRPKVAPRAKGRARPRGSRARRAPPKKKSLSIRGYAAHRRAKGLDGGTPPAVQKALRSGRLPSARKAANGHWRIDPVVADREWRANTDSTRLPEGSEARPALPGMTWAQARALREEFAARKAQLDYERAAGKLISADQARRETFQSYRTVRDRLLRVGDRLEAKLGLEAADLVRAEIREALEEIACVDPDAH